MIKGPAGLFGGFDTELGDDFDYEEDDFDAIIDQDDFWDNFSEDSQEEVVQSAIGLNLLGDGVPRFERQNSDLDQMQQNLNWEHDLQLGPDGQVSQVQALRALRARSYDTNELNRRVIRIQQRVKPEQVDPVPESEGFEERSDQLEEEESYEFQLDIPAENIEDVLAFDFDIEDGFSDSEENFSSSSLERDLLEPPRKPTREEKLSALERRLRSVENFGKDWDEFFAKTAAKAEREAEDSSEGWPMDPEDRFLHEVETVFENDGLLNGNESEGGTELDMLTDTESDFNAFVEVQHDLHQKMSEEMMTAPGVYELTQRVDSLTIRVENLQKRTGTFGNHKDSPNFGKGTPRRGLAVHEYQFVFDFEDDLSIKGAGLVGNKLKKARKELRQLQQKWKRLQKPISFGSELSEQMRDDVEQRVNYYQELVQKYPNKAELLEGAQNILSYAERLHEVVNSLEQNRVNFEKQINLESQGDCVERIKTLSFKAALIEQEQNDRQNDLNRKILNLPQFE